MKHFFIPIVVTMIVATIALCSCEKEVAVVEDNYSTEHETQISTDDSVLVVDGKRMEWKFTLSKPKSLSKGMIMDETEYYKELNDMYKDFYGEDFKLIDTLKFKYHNQNYSLKLLRVDRKSEPGKYFYVMIDNLNVKLDTACWVYGDDESNAKDYGRLYTWHSADALAKEISMRLPVYYANNPTKKMIKTKLPVHARLLSRQDICDIIECDSIGFAPYDGYSIEEHLQASESERDFLPFFYYDVFVGGLEGPCNNVIDYTRGLHTLGGFRNPVQKEEKWWNYWVNGWYIKKDIEAHIRLCDNARFTHHHHHQQLWISREIGNSSGLVENYKGKDRNFFAYINIEWTDLFGFSVRYVFEPMYK